ncbi:MAG: PSD1 domain-containing protein [Bryobacterales bacterium]|nr:PSD1 domain-containing protein [Bryobacterales bacterium]
MTGPRTLLVLLAAAPALWASPEDLFESRVRPVLASQCSACHAKTRMGGLRLDSREALLAGGNTGPALVPGDPDGSLLVQALRYEHARLRMPPAGKLDAAAITAFEEWIRAGAPWPETAAAAADPLFWSFQPVRRVEPPAVQDRKWVRSPVDAFILAKLEETGLRPAPFAGRREWIRRVAFDLTGLPPAPETVDAFLADSSPEAAARVVDRLLASPRYGERWARMWLDLARHADDRLIGAAPYAWHYRDWVIRAFNEDMPYDRFITAQLAADLLPDGRRDLAALTIFTESPSEVTDDDRVDVLTRGFLGLTVACAQCHDHKYDPVPTRDYYSLLGIFRSTRNREIPLAPEAEVAAYRARKKALDDWQSDLKQYQLTESMQVGEMLAAQSARYMLAAAGMDDAADLDRETLDRWKRYLARTDRQHPYLRAWDAAPGRKAAEEFQELVLAVIREKKGVDAYNRAVSLGFTTGMMLGKVVGRTMDRAKFMLWQDLLAEGNRGGGVVNSNATEDGILYYKGQTVERFLPDQRRRHLDGLRARVEAARGEVPPEFPYLLAIEDLPEPVKQHVYVRGNPDNPGEVAPRRFLTVLSKGEPPAYGSGSGRLELARAIASRDNPLTARVIVNRIWQQHFGQGIVRTPSNFGMNGDRPSHPELLDFLAGRLMDSGWSLKTLHREIVLSSVYGLSAEGVAANERADADNRLLWRAKRRRLEAESLRDAVLAASGSLDLSEGGPPLPLADPGNVRRSIYGFISRGKTDPMLMLFDFPNPNTTAEQRVPTNVPSQRLFLLNAEFMLQQAERLAARLTGGPEARIREAYRLLFQRLPAEAEMEAGLAFTKSEGRWPAYAQALLASNEFLYVD